jgi:hypothetical protein
MTAPTLVSVSESGMNQIQPSPNAAESTPPLNTPGIRCAFLK